MSASIVLASSSPYRRQLLARLGIEFLVDAAAIDESPLPGESPEQLVLRLSHAKADTVAARHPAALVIASDQVGVLDGTILTKPGSGLHAREQLRAASGRDVRFLTGICVLDTVTSARRSSVETCVVSFRELADATIDAYVQRENPVDCAGSFKVEGLGIALFRRLQLEDPTALEGLPLIRLVEYLGELGHPVLPA